VSPQASQDHQVQLHLCTITHQDPVPAWVALYKLLVSIDADTHHSSAIDVAVTIEARDKLFVVGHLKSGGTPETDEVSVYV